MFWSSPVSKRGAEGAGQFNFCEQLLILPMQFFRMTRKRAKRNSNDVKMAFFRKITKIAQRLVPKPQSVIHLVPPVCSEHEKRIF